MAAAAVAPPASPAQSMDERAALQAARRGDATAFGRLVRQHQGRVRRQLRRLCAGDAALADDLAQDTFVQAWQGLAAFRGDAQLSTWLHRLAYSRYLMHRRAAAARLPPAPMAAAEATGDAVADGTGAAHRVHGDASDPALRIDMRQALMVLTADEHDALVHCVALELTLDEAAEVLAVPLGTLKSRLARARARLRELLADWKPKERT
ncbi:MAG: RNA polymerase sigma factor [Aquabacterium sp.]